MSADEENDELVWDEICMQCAKTIGIPFQKAKAVLEGCGYHAYAHHGFADALETVEHVLRKETP